MYVFFERLPFCVDSDGMCLTVTLYPKNREHFDGVVHYLKELEPCIDYSYSDHNQDYHLTLYAISPEEKSELRRVVSCLSEVGHMSHNLSHDILAEISSRELQGSVMAR